MLYHKAVLIGLSEFPSFLRYIFSKAAKNAEFNPQKIPKFNQPDFSGSITIIEPIKPIITANQRFISTFSESIAGAKIVIKIVTSCPRAIVFPIPINEIAVKYDVRPVIPIIILAIRVFFLLICKNKVPLCDSPIIISKGKQKIYLNNNIVITDVFGDANLTIVAMAVKVRISKIQVIMPKGTLSSLFE